MSHPFLATVPLGHKFGELNIAASATQLSNIECQMVMLQAKTTNAGNVYYGGPGVTVPDGTADTTSGICLTAGSLSPWIPCRNLNELYAIAASANDDLIYHCIT